MSLFEQFAMPINEAIFSQRSIRRVKPDAIDDEILIQLVEFATKAPNSMNKQDWEFIIVKDPAVKAKLAKQNGFMWRLIKRSMDRKAEKEPEYAGIHKAMTWSCEHFDEYPAMIIACCRGPRFAYPPILGASLYGSIFPAVQNLMLAARAIGLGANLTTMPFWSNWFARRILGIPFSITPTVLITLGWPIGKYGPTQRKPVGDVISLDRYGNKPWLGKRAVDCAQVQVKQSVIEKEPINNYS